MRFTSSIVVALWIGACGSSAPPAASSRSAIGTSECTRFGEVARDSCKNDFKASFDACQTQARFAEAGGCIAQAVRSYDCSMEGITKCSDQGCCESAYDRCKPLDLALENCLRGYCTDHAGNPDCGRQFAPPAAPN